MQSFFLIKKKSYWINMLLFIHLSQGLLFELFS